MSGSRWSATTPSRERPLSEVQDRVAERWREDEIAARLKAKATELADKLKTSTVNEVAAAAGLKAQSVKGLKRGAVSDAVPAKVVNDVFATPKDGVGNSEGDRPTYRVVFRVTDINVPKLDPASPEAKQLENALRTAGFEDLVSQYIHAPASRSRHDHQRSRPEPGAVRRRAKLSAGMRPEPPIDLFAQPTTAATRRSSGRRWSPISRRRFRPS